MKRHWVERIVVGFGVVLVVATFVALFAILKIYGAFDGLYKTTMNVLDRGIPID